MKKGNRTLSIVNVERTRGGMKVRTDIKSGDLPVLDLPQLEVGGIEFQNGDDIILRPLPIRDL